MWDGNVRLLFSERYTMKTGQRSGISCVASWLKQTGVAVPYAIFIAYFWTLAYHAGFAFYFNIPYSFISINPVIILGTHSILIVALSFISPLLIPLVILAYNIIKLLKNIPKLGRIVTQIKMDHIVIFSFFIAPFGGYGLYLLGEREAKTESTFRVLSRPSH